MNKEDLTIFVGNLHDKVTEEILYELFLQAGPVKEVRIPSSNGVKKNFGFVEYKHEISVPYALLLFDGTRFYDRSLKLNSRSNCLHLFRPPQQIYHIERRSSREDDDSSSLRAMGGSQRKRFTDKSMLPTGPSRKVQKMRDESPPREDYSSLRFPPGRSFSRMDNFMLPTNPSRNSRELSPPRKPWSPKHYPSQLEEPKGYERGGNVPSRSKNRHDRGISDHLSKPHFKIPYNEKHHNRDKNRFDSYPSQRSRHHRPHNR